MGDVNFRPDHMDLNDFECSRARKLFSLLGLPETAVRKFTSSSRFQAALMSSVFA